MSRTTKFFQKGYHHGEVEGFLKTARSAYEGTGGPANFSAVRVRAQGFCVMRGGYNFAQVDAAMDRLESAFVMCVRADHATVNGQKVWMNLVSEQTITLYPRLLRSTGKRFSHPEGRKRGYHSADVDTLLECLVVYFDKNKPLTSREIRDAIFTGPKGTRVYTEGSVDAYLAHAVEVLLATE